MGRYRMNQQCFFGRPDQSMEYYLANGNPPTGSFSGENCADLKPDKITMRWIDGRWKIVEGDHWILDFSNKKDEAEKSLKIIKKYQFSRICFIGRPNALMVYFRG
jgi:hypothetical protein